MSYLLPTSIEAALSLLDSAPENERAPTIVAGATDYYPQLSHTVAKIQPTEDILDITRLDELRLIQEVRADQQDGDYWRIGALATWAGVSRTDMPPAFAGLQHAATQIGSVQIQNAATIVGNVCNASPAADGVPPLLTLGAKVELRSLTQARLVQTRLVPLEEFILGNRRTARQPNELVTAILIPTPQRGMVGSFEKLGARAYLAISIVMVAAVADIDEDGTINSARIAVGACSEVAQRLPDLEHDLVGVQVSNLGTDFSISDNHLAPLAPISDVRASATYRMSVTPPLIARALAQCRQQKNPLTKRQGHEQASS